MHGISQWNCDLIHGISQWKCCYCWLDPWQNLKALNLKPCDHIDFVFNFDHSLCLKVRLKEFLSVLCVAATTLFFIARISVAFAMAIIGTVPVLNAHSRKERRAQSHLPPQSEEGGAAVAIKVWSALLRVKYLAYFTSHKTAPLGATNTMKVNDQQ